MKKFLLSAAICTTLFTTSAFAFSDVPEKFWAYDAIKFMEESTDFFTAPASTRFHGDHEGGLLEHSLKVYEILNEKLKHTPIEMNIPDDTIKIAALLHDICKVNFYKVSYRNAKNELGVWEKVPYYTIEDTIPYGHGEKSVMMITEYIKLTP